MFEPISSIRIGLNDPEETYLQFVTIDDRVFTIAFTSTEITYGYTDANEEWHWIWRK